MGKKAVITVVTIFVVFVLIATVTVILCGSFAIKMGEDSTYSKLSERLVIEDKDIDNITMSLEACNLEIVTGEKFTIITDSENIRCKQEGNSINIKEKSGIFSWFNKRGANMTITVPKGFEFDKLDLTVGAAKVDIGSLKVDDLRLEIGAGKADIGVLEVTDKAIVNIGAGKLDVESGAINNLDLEIGAGKATFESKLTGDTDIEVGVGKLDYLVVGDKKDYTIKVSKGVGELRIDRDMVHNKEVIGNGINRIDVENGVGSISVEFKK